MSTSGEASRVQTAAPPARDCAPCWPIVAHGTDVDRKEQGVAFVKPQALNETLELRRYRL
jgi:hypothetical protein